MHSLVKFLIVVLTFFFTQFELFGQDDTSELDYGLSFSSHEVTKDQRTALNLNPESAFQFVAGTDFQIQFDFALRRLTNAYGYVLRIVGDDSLNFDIVSSPEHEEFHDLNLIVNNHPTNVRYNHQDVDLQPMQWTPIKIEFNGKKNIISISWRNQVKTHPYPVQKLQKLRCFFGANDFGKFNTADVPPMMIRNVSVTIGEKTISWKLKRHGIDNVLDERYEKAAMVKNPTWLIDRHIQWVHRKSFSVGKYPSVAFDAKSGNLFASDEASVHVINLWQGTSNTRTVTKGNVAYTDANQLLFIPETSELINYDLHTNILSRFNFENNTWDNTNKEYNQPNYWHNNKFYNPHDQSVYTFGGYGHFSYKNQFLRFDNDSRKWIQTAATGSIPPRYLAALGITSENDRALIFGGYGSESGKQELFPQSFYDLYSFNLKTHEVKKLQDYKALHLNEDIVFSNSLIINEKDSCFYVLSFPKNKYESHIKLRRYEMATVESTVLADSIPFQFHDEHSFCDLFLSTTTKELFAVTCHKEKEQYKVNVYAINYPPLSGTDVMQETGSESNLASTALYVVIGAVLVIGAILFVRKNTKNTSPAPRTVFAEGSNAEVVKTLPENEKVVSATLLFGGFQVIDKSGTDITAKFTMTLKELFVMILLHTIKHGKGVSASMLQENLWPDKDEVSARNNRNVNIKKLRSLLEEIGDISIENNNSYLRLIVHDNSFCDYELVSKIITNSAAISPAMMDTLLKYVKKGNLLPNLQSAWLDSFKSDISNKIIDILLEYSQRLDTNKDDKVLLDIADAIFNYDSINQEALVIKCSVLNKKGKHSLAKTWYDHFVKEYNNLYSENYPKTFEEVIS